MIVRKAEEVLKPSARKSVFPPQQSIAVLIVEDLEQIHKRKGVRKAQVAILILRLHQGQDYHRESQGCIAYERQYERVQENSQHSVFLAGECYDRMYEK